MYRLLLKTILCLCFWPFAQADELKWLPDKTSLDTAHHTSRFVYNEKAHLYSDYYAKGEEYGGVLDACELSGVDLDRASIKWTMYKHSVTTKLSPNTFVSEIWKTIWESGWSNKCSLHLRSQQDRLSDIGWGGSESNSGLVGDGHLSVNGPALPGQGRYRLVAEVMEDGNSQRRTSFTKAITIKDLLIVLVGDSYASGEGNPDQPGEAIPLVCDATTLVAGDPFYDYFNEFNESKDPANPPDNIIGLEQSPYQVAMAKEPDWLDISAHRSMKSGHALAVIDLADRLIPEIASNVTFLNFAVSGAEIENVKDQAQNYHHFKLFRSDPERGCSNCGQLDELKRTIGDRPIDILIVSAGGNDVGFSDALKSAVTGNIEKHDFQNRLLPLFERYEELDRDIRRNFDVGHIVLTGYPIDLFSRSKTSSSNSCEIFEASLSKAAGLDFYHVQADEIETLKQWGGALRDAQAIMAARLDWSFVDVSDEFVGHGYCTFPNSFFRSAEGSCRRQGDTMGVMHPNQNGHAVYRQLLGEELRRILGAPG